MFGRNRSGARRSRRALAQLTTSSRRTHRRKPLFELLEDRRMLAVFTVTSNLDTVNAADGVLTLREAVNAANADPTTFDSIKFAPSLAGATIQLSNLGELKLTSQMLIDGSSLAFAPTIKAFDNSVAAGDGTRIFNINDGVATETFVTLTGLTLTGGDVPIVAGNNKNGGAVYSTESLSINNCTITGNVSGGRGGGVYATGTTYIGGSSFTKNTAAYGGGLDVQGTAALPVVTISNSSFSKNTGSKDGGNIYMGHGTLNMSGSTIASGSTGGNGAGILLDTVAWTIDKTTISANKADASAGAAGGGVFLHNSNGEITNSTIGPSGTLAGNTSNSNGAGILINGATAKITNTTITGNTAAGSGSGGGVFVFGAQVTISGSTISNNSAGFGAGLYFNNATAPISTTTISGNIAGSIGGGAFAKGGAIINFDSSTISGNSAVLNGGGLYTTGSNTGFVNSTVSGNTAKAFGGGIFAQVPASRSMNLLYSTVTKNISDFDASGVGSGGGIYLKTGGGTVDLTNTIVAGNSDFTNTAPDIDNTSAGGNPTLTTSFSLIGNNKNSGLAAGGLIGTPAAPINPKLGTLSNNGGPTKTVALLLGSPAINAGNPAPPAPPAFDQRGAPFVRIADGRLDIGAFEFTPPATAPTMALLPSSDSGMFNTDNVTNKMQPAFGGVGPSDRPVYVYAQQTDATGAPLGVPFVVGTGTVNPDGTDGVIGNGLGTWEVTVEPMADGKWLFFSRFDILVQNPDNVTDVLSDPVGAAPATRTPIDVPKSIPANGVAVSQITGGGGGGGAGASVEKKFVASMTVNVTLTHPHDGDLTLILIGPDGTSVVLSNQHGGNNANYTNTTFDDTAVLPISVGAPPFTGRFQPDESLSAFFGEPVDGTWTLEVLNAGNINTGSIVNWSISTEAEIGVVIDTVAPNTPNLNLITGADTGRNNNDKITNFNNPDVTMTSTDPNGQFAQLLFSDNLKFRIYDRYTSTGSSSGTEVLVYDSAQDSAADMDMNNGDMFTADTHLTAFLPFLTPSSPGIKPDGTFADGTHNLKLVVEDRAGNISADAQMTLTIDTTPPTASFGLPTANSATDGLIAASDSGVTTLPATYADRITNVSTPTFWGRAEANSIVNVYYDKNADGLIEESGPNADIFLGQTVAVPYDGNDGFPNGYWQVTSALDLNQITGVPKDGLRRILMTAEDVAGNPTPSFATDFPIVPPTDQLQIFIDTQGPQVTALTPNNSNFNLFSLKPAQTGPTPAVTSLQIAFKDLPSRADATDPNNKFLYDALVTGIAQTAGNYVLVGDHVGTIAIQSITVTNTTNQITGVTLTGTQTTTVLTASALVGATTQPEVGDYILITTGAAISQVRRITAYNAATGAMTLDVALLTAPAAGDTITITKAATAVATLTFATPLPDDRYTLTIKDSLVDPAGNKLDGESHQIEPQGPLFPSGDGVPGGNFVARFTVDSHPEIGNYVSQNINIDINGDRIWDPASSQIGGDATNVDLTFTLQVQTAAGATAPGGFNVHDLLFAGKFLRTAVTNGASLSTHFDQLAAFGNAADLGGVFRWLVDTNGDGVITLGTDIETTQPALGNFNINGAIPVAGNFDNNTANGDEIGLYNAGKWYLDTNHNFVIDGGDTLINSSLFGAPIVGDFDGDGKVDLAVFNNNVFSFDLANNGFGTTDATIVWGFPGVLDKPVAADMDGDGITDIGLWVPRTDATNPAGVAQWYFLISNDFATPGVAAAHTAGSIAKINHQFSPTPLGHDFFAEFGDERSLPIVGNFDPPISAATLAQTGIAMGDYDGNGHVDQSDLNVWKASFGSTTNLAADGNHNGVIDTADYAIWRMHMGQVLSGGGAESLSAGGAAESLTASTPQMASITAAPITVAPPITTTSASVTEPTTLVPVAASASSTAADQMDRALLLLLNGTPPAVVANLGDLAMATDAQGNADQEDATAADAVTMAWQSWSDL